MTNQTSIDYHPAIDNKRVNVVSTIEIKSAPDKVFPLACPVEELRWLPHWECQLIYTNSGINENNCVFRENLSGAHLFEKPVTTTWVTTLHDTDRYRVQFLLSMEDKAIIKWDLSCSETGINVTTCTLNLVFTGLHEEANALNEENIKAKLQAIILFTLNALKHYCETGKPLS